MDNEISIEERELATNIYHLRMEKLYTEAISHKPRIINSNFPHQKLLRNLDK